ncbi:MAG TPA: tyrosine-type recombinase/integrase [Pseudonocardiaceae bacterium]|nr:tyrosine-type recombinase/integrase [Pseudonocardiaceae bacterium]
MSVPVPARSPGPHRRVLERLLGAVRPEFRADVLVFPAEDPVFGGGACRVQTCPRPARGHGLCQGHHLRWVGEGRPDLDEFAATTDPRWRRQRPNMQCRILGCGFGAARGGLCQLHHQRWDRAGSPDPGDWTAPWAALRAPAPGAVCRIDHCRLWPQPTLPFCHSHANTWKVNGRPDLKDFVRGFDEVATTEEEIIRLDRLSPQLKLEIQYALQCRRDQPSTKTLPAVVMALVRLLAATNAVSLLDRAEDQWRTQIGRPAPQDGGPRALLIYARRQVEDLADAGGWEAEFGRDVWQMRRLGFTGNQQLTFTRIPQPWLRDLVKRWLRWRLGTGLGLPVASRGLLALTRFAVFCQRIDITALAGIDRPVIERYLADLHAELAGRQRHGDHIGQLNMFLHAVRQHHWDDSLPATALVFTDDFPRRAERPPRALAEQVMAQIEDPTNLGRFTNPAYQLVTLILIRAGLRVTDALSIPRDCLVTDADGAPYLRYDNHKMKRQALVPIDEQLHALIIEQQTRVGQAPVLFPRPTKNPDGRAPVASSTYRPALYRWLARCEIRDTHGQPVALTPHQWRHTLGTRLINRDVPQEVVRRILDHDSPQMTAHYARLHDTTVRRHWEAARKVDITGDVVVVDPAGPLAEAAWAKQRLGRATQALPNGFCGLPVQKTCPHANACLTCPMFVTTAEFLPQHHTHRQQVIELITAAQARGQNRLVEMNQQVLGNLDNIIGTLADAPASPTVASDAS